MNLKKQKNLFSDTRARGFLSCTILCKYYMGMCVEVVPMYPIPLYATEKIKHLHTGYVTCNLYVLKSRTKILPMLYLINKGENMWIVSVLI